ncbi:MAG TPA: protein kinase, partial [Candidatus Melainabacteria bacterium]|nr:protein kinase [Candidatus Melainabacteria bacterium]
MSHNGNPRFSAPNAGGDCRENDSNSQPKFAALAESQPKKDFSPPAISKGASSSSRKLSPETTIQKMREFQGESSIYEASMDSLSVIDDYSKANPFMSVAQLKEAHAELKQRSSPEKQGELITRYEELSSKKAEEAREDPMLGIVLDNRYKINGLVGSGANATVYKAKRLTDGEIVAVKTIRNRGIEEIWRFKLEIESMRKMQHENLVNYIDCIVQEKGRIFLVMELVQGISLQEVLSLHGPITDEETICHILAQVADALAHAHEKGIIH